MALLSSKKKIAPKAKVAKTEVATMVKPASPLPHTDIASVIRHPRVTEKAAFAAEKNIYVFSVSLAATKHTIAAAIKEMYKVTPVKVNVVTIPSKTVFIRGKKGMKSKGKKAYVFLKKGDKIEIV